MDGGSGAGREAGQARGCFEGRVALVVDDDWLVLKGLELSLSDMGFRVRAVRTVADAGAALDALGEPVAAVVADYSLARGEVGTDAIAEVRRRHPGAAAVLLTGDTSPVRLADAERSGCRLVHKPVEPDRLRELLAGMLPEP